jgi:hypothetical protein
MLNKILIGFLVAGLFACDQIAPTTDKTETEENPLYQVTYYPDGTLQTEINLDSNKRYHGIAKKYYKEGQLKSETLYDHGTTKVAKQYYENGNLEMEFPYEDGQKHGLRKKYWENGQLQSQMTYVKGEPKADLIEYKSTGDKLTTYPTLIVKQIDNINKNGQYVVQTYFSSNPQKGTYYIGELENGVIPRYTEKMKKNGKIGEIIFWPEPGTFFMKKLKIIGTFKTGYGNILIVEKSINLAYTN